MSHLRRSILAFAVSAVLSSASWADVVELTTGQRVEGSFRRAAGTEVVIEVGGREVAFPLEKVRAIYFGASGAASEPKSAAREALQALKAVQVATGEDGVFQDYARRVSEAKARVDRYLSEPERGDAGLRATLNEAVSFYMLALAAWRAKTTNRFEEVLAVARDPALDRCQALKKPLARYPLGNTREQDFARGVVATLEIPLMWSCAADKIEEAETLVGG